MVKFAVVSDVHAEQHPDWSRLVFERMAARTDLDFVAFLGDICTSPGDSWDKYFTPLLSLLKVQVVACRGNHDDLGRWNGYWKQPAHQVHRYGWPIDCRCVHFDSNVWSFDGDVTSWLDHALAGDEKYKFLFTHLTPRIGHWNYGLGPRRTAILLDLCKRHKVTACFTGHMHGFDFLRQDDTLFFICGGGGGGRHDNFPIMHRSNFYLLVSTGNPWRVDLYQQHRDGEQIRPIEEWINETRRPAF